MNTTALKSFAPAVRRQLLEAVTRKLDFVLSAQTPDYVTTFASQVASLRTLAREDRPGLVERVAYTWFNRLTALRYLDAKDWHPFRARVLTSASTEQTQPELLGLTRAGALPEELRRYTDPARLDGLLDGHIPSQDAQGEVYRHLVLAACRFYHALLPNLFERLDDETELLLPDDLLTAHSIAQGFRTEITDEDCTQVEALGWLYQFYISEKKDQVMARKSVVPAEDIPAVTQLFTPHWIVRYLVENSLGRLWLLNRPDSRLRQRMPYYIEAKAETTFLRITSPEEIRLLDPACGSGHILTYAFDLLYAIYEEEGYASFDIPGLILQHNLFGVDICPRAAQLAALALVLKGREKSNRFPQGNQPIAPHILALEDVRYSEHDIGDYSRALNLGGVLNGTVLRLIHQFSDAKNVGSLIEPSMDETGIASARRAIEAKDPGDQLFLQETHTKVLRALEQAEYLTPRYHVVLANPPYMGGRGMNASLKHHVEQNFATGKADLYGAFLARLPRLGKEGSHLGMVTIPNWMFLGSFEQLRRDSITNLHITSLIHNGRGLWGSDFGSCAFTLVNSPGRSVRGVFKRLFVEQGEVSSSEELEARCLDHVRFPFYSGCSEDFLAIPGCPIAYWTSQRFRDAFRSGLPLKRTGDTRQGMATSDNGRFLRLWSEVGYSQIGFGAANQAEADQSDKKWFPYNKGGEYRKWYGNQQFVVNWEKGGREIIALAAKLYGSPTRTVKSMSEYFKECVSWSKISISDIAIRYFPQGFLFDVAGCCIFFSDRKRLEPLLGFLNTIVAKEFLKIFSPTLNFEAGHLAALPILPLSLQVEERIEACVSRAVVLAREDWDNFETSWGFRDLPLLRPSIKGTTLDESWQNWKRYCDKAICQMREWETDNNRLFISSYGLQDELSPEVPLEQITLARPDKRKDMAAFLSYAVGCMMGRYSLDKEDLVLADAEATLADYQSSHK